MVAVALVALLLAGCGGGHGSSSEGGATTAPTTSTPPSPTTGAAQPATTVPSATAPSPLPAGCVADQLAIDVGPPNGAAGSVGYTNTFENISSTTCTLFGYPGMQMLNASGQPIPTHVIRGTSVTVPPVTERLVTLAPRGQASFDMGFATSTGYGNAQCPTSTRVEFTAPNDFQSLTVALAIQPYGGPSIAQLRCGEITVSPVYGAR